MRSDGVFFASPHLMQILVRVQAHPCQCFSPSVPACWKTEDRENVSLRHIMSHFFKKKKVLQPSPPLSAIVQLHAAWWFEISTDEVFQILPKETAL